MISSSSGSKLQLVCSNLQLSLVNSILCNTLDVFHLFYAMDQYAVLSNFHKYLTNCNVNKGLPGNQTVQALHVVILIQGLILG